MVVDFGARQYTRQLQQEKLTSDVYKPSSFFCGSVVLLVRNSYSCVMSVHPDVRMDSKWLGLKR